MVRFSAFCRVPGAARRAPPPAGFLALVGLVLVALAGCAPAEAPPERAPELVSVQRVRFAPIAPTIQLTGTVAARVESDLSFRVAGQIAERNVDVGDHVRAGDVLARLRTEEQEADVAGAQATLDSARVTLRQAETDYARQEQLFAGGIVTRGVFDDAQETLRTSQGAEAAARAGLETAREQLAFTVLTSDTDGIVTAREAEAGQVVAAAQNVFTVAQDGARDAVFDVYETLLAGAPPEGGVEVRLVEDPAVRSVGSVREVSPSFDAQTGTVRVKIALRDPPPAMGLGAAVTGEASTAAQPLVALPWTASSAGEAGASVWVVDEASGTVHARAVRVNRYRTGQLLVEDGLRDGELVVTAGVQFLREGQKVAFDEEAGS